LIRAYLHILIILFSCAVLTAQSASHYENYTVNDDLPSNNIVCIYQDDIGYLWFLTDAGVSRFNGYDFETISEEDTPENTWKQLKSKPPGLYASSERRFSDLPMLANKTHTTALVDTEGSTWIGTKEGGLFYFPRVAMAGVPRTRSSLSTPKVIFEYIGLNSERTVFPGDSIVIPSEYTTLSIGYAALQYTAHGKISYKYKIDGIHDDWITTKDNKIQFTSLPDAGDYVFEVMAEGDNGIWSEPSLLYMEFLTPFYLTWWFRIGVVLIFLSLFWAVIRAFYIRKLKMQNMQSQLSQLEGRALQSQMNPHFVFNSLNSIQSFITTGDTMNSEIYLAKFSNLLRKTLNNSSASTIALSKEIENLEMYLELEKMRFGERLNYEITIDDSVETDLVEVPPMLIQPFVENAIVHGVSRKKEGGNVEVFITHKDAKSLLCTVIDNGVGRQYKGSATHKSLGTGIVKKRLALMGNDSKKNVTYTDIKNEQGYPAGTKIELIIPI